MAAAAGDEAQQAQLDRLAGHRHRAAGGLRLAAGRGRAGAGDQRVGRLDRHVVDAEDGARDLARHGHEALADLDGGAADGDAAVLEVHHRGGLVDRALREGGVLHDRGQAHATTHVRALAGAADASGQVHHGVAGRRVGGRQRHGGAAADDLGHGRGPIEQLAEHERVAVAQRVVQAQLDRVHAQRLGEAVHLRLVGVGGLRVAEAAKRAGAGVVRAHRPPVDAPVGHPVGPLHERGGVEHDDLGGRRVRAAVEHDARFQRHDRAVALGVGAQPDARRVALAMHQERVVARQLHLDRALGGQRQQAGVDLDGHVLAPAEGAADARLDEHDALGRQPEREGDLVAVGVQPLRGHVQLDAALAVGPGQPRLGSQEGMVLPTDDVLGLDVDGTADGRVAAGEVHVAVDVAVGVDRRRGERLERIGQRRQRLVLDGDGGARPLRGDEVLGGDQSDRLADVADVVVGEHVLVAGDQAEHEVGHVPRAHHGVHARASRGRARGRSQDPRVRVRRAQDRAVQHALDSQVVGVGEGSRGLLGGVVAAGRRADRVQRGPAWVSHRRSAGRPPRRSRR